MIKIALRTPNPRGESTHRTQNTGHTRQHQPAWLYYLHRNRGNSRTVLPLSTHISLSLPFKSTASFPTHLPEPELGYVRRMRFNPGANASPGSLVCPSFIFSPLLCLLHPTCLPLLPFFLSLSRLPLPLPSPLPPPPAVPLLLLLPLVLRRIKCTSMMRGPGDPVVDFIAQFHSLSLSLSFFLSFFLSPLCPLTHSLAISSLFFLFHHSLFIHPVIRGCK